MKCFDSGHPKDWWPMVGLEFIKFRFFKFPQEAAWHSRKGRDFLFKQKLVQGERKGEEEREKVKKQK